jgi:hypothetical protein
MRDRVTWTPAEAAPSREAVLALQGIPPRGASARTDELLDRALAIHLERAEPRAIVDAITREEFAQVYRGAGRNAPQTPLESIVPRADGLALFVATVGAPVASRIRELFAANEPALAAMLDSVASAAADRLADLLAARAAATRTSDRVRVLAYSPGYCGWHVSGQGALFATLRPEEIGVTLNTSFLMEPLKSVSGVLVTAAPEVHRFAPAYPFCADCRDKPCRARMAYRAA